MNKVLKKLLEDVVRFCLSVETTCEDTENDNLANEAFELRKRVDSIIDPPDTN